MKKSFYDDLSFSYPKYWQKRKYEHFSEAIALKRLFELIPSSSRGDLIDIGAGFGRLAEIYLKSFKRCVLIDPSRKLLTRAKKNLKGEKNVEFRLGTVEKIPFKEGIFDLVVMIRVAHHLEDLEKAFNEISRVLKPGGFFILEFANKNHFKAKLFSPFSSYQRQKAFCLDPIDISSKKRKIPFINYHPLWIKKEVEKSNFKVITKLSVSNLRFSGFEKLLPLKLLIWIERNFQPFLGKIDFGPSIFLLLRKK